MGVLVLKQMILFCCVSGFLLNSFATIPTGSVNCVSDKFCHDVVSRCLFCVYMFFCLCDC